MKTFSRLSWGVVIYALMYLTWSGFVLYGFANGVLPRLLGLFILIVLATIAGRALRLHSWKDIAPFSFAWALLVALLDAVFSVPYTGWMLYADWNVWVGYTLVFVVPLLSPYTHKVVHTDE